MNPIQYFDVIDLALIDGCLNDYNSRESYDTPSMNKAGPGASLDLLLPTIQKLIGTDTEYRSGNFYKHTDPYLPHTDYKQNQNNNINVVIPLSFTGPQASLIIFDQRWEHDSVTWCLDYPLLNFTVNTGVLGYPCNYDVVGLTDSDIDEEFHSKYLSKYNRKCFHGMSGKAYPFEIGSIMIFDNRFIHATSTFNGEKTGISLRFEKK
jgi:hypothetical protein